MKLKTLLILFMIINFITPSYPMFTRWYARILPITFYEEKWYGLFGHNVEVKEMNQGWNDFNESAILPWADPDEMAVNALNQQTNNRFVLVKQNLEKYGMKLALDRDYIYFYFYQIPQSTSLEEFQDTLTKLSYKPGAYKKIDAYAWVPIEKILKDEKIETSLPQREDEENALKIKNLIVNEDVKNILKANWEEIILPTLDEVLKKQGIILPGQREEIEKAEEENEEEPSEETEMLTEALSSLESKLSQLKQLLIGQPKTLKKSKEKPQEGFWGSLW